MVIRLCLRQTRLSPCSKLVLGIDVPLRETASGRIMQHASQHSSPRFDSQIIVKGASHAVKIMAHGEEWEVRSKRIDLVNKLIVARALYVTKTSHYETALVLACIAPNIAADAEKGARFNRGGLAALPRRRCRLSTMVDYQSFKTPYTADP